MVANVFSKVAIEKIKNIFNSNVNSTNQPEWLFELRKYIFNSSIEKGFPSKKDENYKYTTLEKYFSENYEYVQKSFFSNVNLDEIFKCDIPNFETHLIILINGWYYPSNKQKLLNTVDGVIFGSLLEATKDYSQIIYNYYKNKEFGDFFDELNFALLQDGLFLYIPDGAKLSKPIQIINLVIDEKPSFVFPRNLIISESANPSQILICDYSLNTSPFVMLNSTDFILKNSANVAFYRMQNAHNHSIQITNNYIIQNENSNFKSINITLHGGIVRNNTWALLNGKNSNNSLIGLWLGDKNQHIDNFTFVKHNAPECESYQLFKGILDDEATGIFSGKIFVEKGAQKTNAYQSNKNLVISKNAKVRSRPQLEIYADDVKCSHGSATGKLDDEAMFYLRSRGISHKEACQLLMFAFAIEVTKNVHIEELKSEIESLVDRRLRGNLNRCNRCSITCS
jgi:Fe-S cluster assembly protein SufD